jgi:hypothetical protein
MFDKLFRSLKNSAWKSIKPVLREWLKTRALVLPFVKRREIALSVAGEINERLESLGVPYRVSQEQAMLIVLSAEEGVRGRALEEFESFKP